MIVKVKFGEITKKSAQIFLEHVKRQLEKKDEIVVALSGGSTVIGIFKELARGGDPVLGKVHYFFVDERVVPLDHEDSNYLQAKKLFFDPLLQKKVIQEDHIHPIPYQEARSVMLTDYNEELERVSGGLFFDILLLGIGPDGHIASLFPNHHSIKDDSEGFIFLDDSPKPPPERLTASRKMIENSKVALVLVIDAKKKDALEKYLKGSTTVEECPLKVVNKLKEHVIITDLDIK